MRLLSFGEILFDVFPDRAVPGGAPLNLAAHAALQGANATLWSAVGKDALGDRALREARRLGVDTSWVAQLSSAATGVCNVTLDENAIPSYRLVTDAAFDHIPFPAERWNEPFDILAFGTMALRHADNRAVLERLLTARSFDDVYCDLNIRAPFYSKESILLCLSHATILKVSDEELPTVSEVLWGASLPKTDALQRLRAEFPQLRLLLLTCGAEGALVLESCTGTLHACAASPATPISTVGAGDSFGATFLVEHRRHGNIERALRRAADVSAFVISRAGAVPEDMQAFLNS